MQTHTTSQLSSQSCEKNDCKTNPEVFVYIVKTKHSNFIRMSLARTSQLCCYVLDSHQITTYASPEIKQSLIS